MKCGTPSSRRSGDEARSWSATGPAPVRIALLSDIHGNAVALDAVLADVEARGGADGYWVLGDLVALGPDPVGVLERLERLPDGRFVRGNTDRYVAFGDRPGPTAGEAARDATLLPSLVEVAGTFAWTQGMVTAAGWLDWLRDLPLELEAALPDGTRLLGVHASPGCDDGNGVQPGTSDDEIERLFSGCDADVVCLGHTHVPFDRRAGARRIVNLGAVSLTLTADKRASYAMLEADARGHRIWHRSVAYDRAAVIDELVRTGHPGRGYLIRHLSDPPAA